MTGFEPSSDVLIAMFRKADEKLAAARNEHEANLHGAAAATTSGIPKSRIRISPMAAAWPSGVCLGRQRTGRLSSPRPCGTPMAAPAQATLIPLSHVR